MYLIFAEAVSPWLALPGLGNIGFTLVFVLFALVHCTAVEGLPRTAIFFTVSAVVSFLMEEAGVRTGLIFGPYHYGDALGAKLGHVPIIIPLAWFMMIYPSWMVAKAIVRGVNLLTLQGLIAQAAIASLVMTAWEVVMDPGMTAAGVWVWEQGGSYFGVPRHNYLGWLLTTFLVYLLTAAFWRRGGSPPAQTRLFAALPVIVYAFFALRYVTAGWLKPLQVVALFSMGFPALVALTQIFLSQNNFPRSSVSASQEGR
jgi:putative membrane protein